MGLVARLVDEYGNSEPLKLVLDFNRVSYHLGLDGEGCTLGEHELVIGFAVLARVEYAAVFHGLFCAVNIPAGLLCA